MTREWRWLLAGTALCAVAVAAPPPTPAPGQPESPAQRAPDDEFIEFLGADDVGDETWWELLKKAPPRRENPPARPPQEAKQ